MMEASEQLEPIFWRIPVDAQMIASARAYEATVLANLKGGGRNYTGLHLPGRFYDGRLAELAYSRRLIELNVIHVDMVRDDGMPDEGDIEIYLGPEARPLVIDVKGSRVNDPSVMLFVTKMARDKHKAIAAYLIGKVYGERYQDTLVEIRGWTTKDILARSPITDVGHGPSHIVRSSQLFVPDGLIATAVRRENDQAFDERGYPAGFLGE